MIKDDMCFPKKLETDRLILKKVSAGDVRYSKEILAAVKESFPVQKEFCPWAKHENLETVEKYIKTALKRWKKYDRFLYFIFDKKTKDFLGEVSLHSFVKWNKTAEIGYWLTKSATGYGYCQEAVREIEKMAFQHNLNRLIAKIDSTNKKSNKTIQALGYHLDGVLRQDSYIWDLKIMDDTNYYSKLKSELK